MWKKMKQNIEAGIAQVKWFSSLLNERVKIEMSLFRLLYQSDEMDKKRGELLKKIGERVIELKHSHERQVWKDSVITETVNAVERLDEQISELKQKASDIQKVEA